MKLLASDPIYQQKFDEINSDNGIIRGVKVCSEGPARGHGVFLNKDFVNAVVDSGHEQKQGVKARFGHPNMCSTALGTYIGRYRNYRTHEENDQRFEEEYKGQPERTGARLHAVADLHLDKTAKALPKIGNAWDYVLDMAEMNPDMFGNSIVFRPGDTIHHTWEDDQGNEQSRNDATLESLLATDLVDNPAATDGLFESFNEDELVMQATMFLDQNPAVYDLAVNNPEVVETFLRKYQDYKSLKQSEMTETLSAETKTEVKSMFDELKTFIAGFFKADDKDEPVIPAEVTDRLDTLKKQIDDLPEPITVVDEPDPAIAQAAEDLAAAKQKIAEFETAAATASAKVLELEAKLTQGNAPSTKVSGPEGAEDPDYDNMSAEKKSLLKDLAGLRGEFDRSRD